MIFPGSHNGEALIAIPLVLPMGWTNSGPAFCAATETIADSTNAQLPHRHTAPHHELSTRAAELDSVLSHAHPDGNLPACHPSLPSGAVRPAAYVDVFVDDFIALAQGRANRLRMVRDVLFHNIDKVFRALDEDDKPTRKQPISVKKLLQGDCSWATEKQILGWDVDSARLTIRLPRHRVERLQEILEDIPPSQRRTSLKRWQKIVGELRSMVFGLPGARGLFSSLQDAMQRLDGRNRVPLSDAVHQALADFAWLGNELHKRPTRIAELVPLQPSVCGAHDAAASGAGGVIFASQEVCPRDVPGVLGEGDGPIVWRVQFPPELEQKLVSWNNPRGIINNSQLELAGCLLHFDSVAHLYDVRERTVKADSDNTPTVFWGRKGSATTTGCTANLLRAMALHQRHHRYVPRHDYISGECNVMADDASRLHHLSNTDFLAHFNRHYPQSKSWRLWHPPSEIVTMALSAVLNKPFAKESVLAPTAPLQHTGVVGSRTANRWASTPYLQTCKTPSNLSKCLPSSTGTEPSLPVVSPSALEQWKVPYGRLAKRSRVWGPQTPVTRRMVKSISVYGACGQRGGRKTPLRTA